MLSYQLLKNHAGILLVGDYDTLRCLHEIVHDVNDRSPLIADEEDSFLGLAYDVRKAYEKQRETLEPPRGYEEMGPRYGVKILWPVLMTQHRMLRASLAYIDHGKRHQAITYALEAVIEDGVTEDFGGDAKPILARWHALDPTRKDFFDLLDTRGALFCSWSKTERKRRTQYLLASFEYVPTSSSVMTNPDMIRPDELEEWKNRDWPDPKC